LGLGTGATAAIVGGIGAAGSIASGAIGANAAGNAASTQASAANNAAALQAQEANNSLDFSKLQYGNSLQLMSPYINSGTSSLKQLDYLMGLSPSQGLPPGVVNPNSPQGATSSAVGNTSPVTSNPLAGSNAPFVAGGNREVAQSGQVPMSTQSLAAQFNGANGNTAQSAQAGIQQPGVTDVTGPTGITGGPVMAGTAQFPSTSTTTGQPGQVPIQGGGTATGNTINQGGTAQVPMQGAATGTNPDPNANGGFGSLAQNFDQTFQAPTDVTEQNDPGYQFRLQQGQQALQNSAAARGGLLSGGTAKALSDYNQNAASAEYGNVYNRAYNKFTTDYNQFQQGQTNQFNRYASLAGLGQTSAQQLSNSGLTTANNVASINANAGQQIGQNINNAGAANASGYVGSANAINGAIGGGTSTLSQLALLQSLQNGGGTPNLNPTLGNGVT
jgi:hypothetical protein